METGPKIGETARELWSLAIRKCNNDLKGRNGGSPHGVINLDEAELQYKGCMGLRWPGMANRTLWTVAHLVGDRRT